jgi:hypothetical protein
MDNLEKSRIALGAILAHLYERGIQSGSVSLMQLGLDESYKPFLTQGFLWLKSEGLLSANKIQITASNVLIASGACLTAKGFDVLGTTMVGKSETLGQQLANLARDTEKTARGAVISEVVGQVIGIAARAYMAPSQ